MKSKITEALLACGLVLAFILTSNQASNAEVRHSFGVEGKHFVLDGKPFQIISGELHYSRIPREYWRARLKMARAMGLNTIATYVFWNAHEPKPGQYDFSGQQDVATFIRIAEEEGLKVILRPGPYSCAEWELGGYPAWLLADPDMVLRSNNESFMRPAQRWIERLGKELAGLQIGRGGPIIAVQVENEYGSFDNDAAYLRGIYDMLRKAGFTQSLLLTDSTPSNLAAGSLPEIPSVVNFGLGGAKKGFEKLEQFRPNGPMMVGEWWSGWFDHWGQKHHTTDGEAEAKELDWVLSKGYSISYYMFHGGTSWGFMNGANVDAGRYGPDVSSYDYSAALDESGRPTKKYFIFRDLITKHTGQQPPEVPTLAPTIQVPNFKLQETAALFENLPTPISSERPRNMESYGQSYGYILYRTEVSGPVSGELVLADLRDYAQIYLNGKLIGTLDRRLKQDRLPFELTARKAQLEILVENSGRVNFGKEMRAERKGITKSVTLAGKELTGWQVFTLPIPYSYLSKLRYSQTPATGPAFYKGIFQLSEIGDTFLDLRHWSKGTVWVNGHQLGRFWNIGPQQTLYVPGPWLKKGANEVVVFDLLPQENPVLQGLTKPILDSTRGPEERKPDIVLEKELTHSDNQSYKMLPFQVPENVSRITVKFDYTGREQRTTINVGMFDPQSFRGWSGGNRKPITIAETDATTSYSSGPIQPGVWNLLLGIPNIRQGVESKFRAEVFFTRRGSNDRLNEFSGTVREGAAWYRGELHSHTANSDGTCKSTSGKSVGCPVFKTLETATARGLNFIAVSDHNDTAGYDSLRKLAPYFDSLAFVHARELTTFVGHANIFGIEQFVDFRVSPSDPQGMNKVFKAVTSMGGLVSINHPGDSGGEGCLGCGWIPNPATDLHLVQAVEVVNGDDSGTKRSGVPFWENLLNQGYRLTALCGSDNHNAQGALPGPGSIGYPTAVIYADNLSENDILAGIRAGHVFVDVEGSNNRMVELSAHSQDKSVMMGDVLSLGKGKHASLSIHVSNVSSGTIELIEDGSVAQTSKITGDDTSWSVELQGDENRHWTRVNVRSDNGKLLLLSNPIYFNWTN